MGSKNLTPAEFYEKAQEAVTEYLYTYAKVVRCKDCKYFDKMEDTAQPGYRECHYFSNWASAYYMLPNDGCTCGKRKDEVEE